MIVVDVAHNDSLMPQPVTEINFRKKMCCITCGLPCYEYCLKMP